MDPFSIAAGVVGILDTVTSLSRALSLFKDDYKLADADLDVARQHALLLKEEIRALDSKKELSHPPLHKDSEGVDGGHLCPEETAFAKAMSTACELLSTIEASFSLRSEPHTWRSKVRWAIKDKRVFQQVKDRLKSAESTLQGIAAMEQLRVSHTIYELLQQQQATLNGIQSNGTWTKEVLTMSVMNQSSVQPFPSVIQTQLSKTFPISEQSPQIMPNPTKLLPWIVKCDLWGSSAQVIALPKGKGKSYQADVHISMLGKLYTIQLQLSCPDLSFDRMLHVCNIVPSNSAMTAACKSGDFNSARKLLASGAAQGSDVTSAGWPMLDYAIESGSARLVRLLLEHGAHPDMSYGVDWSHHRTALQSAFLRGRLDIARILLARGANIEHVDSDGYSVLSYLWIVDESSEKSIDFMRLCLANEFAEVNACDSRGWSAFHRAAAIGTSEDVEAFLRLGASLALRAQWYGWTALFFAASHDNIETFQTIVRHSATDVCESLDGDGWTLLHCCVYFDAPRVMKLVLENGINVNQLSHPAPLPEDPALSYRALTPSDIAIYVGPNRYKLFLEILAETGRDADLEGSQEIYWEPISDTPREGYQATNMSRPVYGAEDVDDDRWTLLHWASYNGSSKVKSLLLLKGADPEHLDAISLEENPTLLSKSPFEER